MAAISRILTVGACALTVAAAQPAIAEDVTLRFPTWQLQEAGFGDFWRETTAAFSEANPDVSFDLEQIAFPNYSNQMVTEFASGNPPPMLLLSGSMIGSFAGQGWLEPIAERAEGTALDDGDWSTLQAYYEWEGEPIGVLVMGYGVMLFYNEELLENAGVEVPTDFEEFTEAVAAVTDRDAGIFGLSALSSEYRTIVNDLVGFIRWNGGHIVTDEGYQLTSPETLAAFEIYRDTVGQNTPHGLNHTLARQLFLDGNTAFLVDGPWVYSLIQSSASEEMRPILQMTALPFEPRLGGAANSIHISASATDAEKDAAWRYIEFIMQPEWQRRYLLLTSSPPGLADVLTEDDLAAQPHLGQVAESAAGAESIPPLNTAIRLNANEYVNIMQRLAVQLITTDEPIEELAQQAQAELEQSVPVN